MRIRKQRATNILLLLELRILTANFSSGTSTYVRLGIDTHTKKNFDGDDPTMHKELANYPIFFYILINTKDGPKPSRLSKGGPH
jgi:hypothetical protein